MPFDTVGKGAAGLFGLVWALIAPVVRGIGSPGQVEVEAPGDAAAHRELIVVITQPSQIRFAVLAARIAIMGVDQGRGESAREAQAVAEIGIQLPGRAARAAAEPRRPPQPREGSPIR